MERTTATGDLGRAGAGADAGAGRPGERGTDGASAPAPRELALRRRLDALRGADVPPRALDARALAALAANPGCRRRTLLDGAGIDKGALAEALGRPAPFGQSQFAFARGNAFEARITADDGAELLSLLAGQAGEAPPEPAGVHVPDLAAPGPRGRTERTRLAIAEAVGTGGWTLLRHPMVSLEVAGAPVYLEPDAAVIGPDGRCTVVEIKSFPILDGAADPAKVGAAARQAAVYVLALQPHCEVHDRVLLVCPKDFSNQPVAEPVDVRKQLAATRRQLARLTRLEAIAAALPADLSLDVRQPPPRLTAAVEAVDAAYAPECLAACELAFHCRARARERGDVTALGRGVRGELGGLRTVAEVVAAASGPAGATGTTGGRTRPEARAAEPGPHGDDRAGSPPGRGATAHPAQTAPDGPEPGGTEPTATGTGDAAGASSEPGATVRPAETPAETRQRTGGGTDPADPDPADPATAGPDVAGAAARRAMTSAGRTGCESGPGRARPAGASPDPGTTVRPTESPAGTPRRTGCESEPARPGPAAAPPGPGASAEPCPGPEDPAVVALRRAAALRAEALSAAAGAEFTAPGAEPGMPGPVSGSAPEAAGGAA